MKANIDQFGGSIAPHQKSIPAFPKSKLDESAFNRELPKSNPMTDKVKKKKS